MRFVEVSLISAFLSVPALAANPLTVDGQCIDGSDFSLTIDLDTAVVSDLDAGPTQVIYDIDPVVITYCGLAYSFTELWVSNNTENCYGPPGGDALWFVSRDNGIGFISIGDQTGTVFSDTSVPQSVDFADFDSSWANTQDVCSPHDGSEGRVTGIGFGPLEDMTLLERATEARDLADLTYLDLGLSGTPRLQSAAAMESYLLTPVAMLEGAGCELDGQIGGAYDLTTMAADDDAGDMTAVSFDRGTKSWTGTMSTGEVITGGYNNQAQSFGARDDGGFYVGRFVQTRGTRGTLYGVTGTCPTPIDYDSVVGGWYRGSLPTP